MKAIAYHHYGSPDVLSLEEVEKPSPRGDEALVKVHAASIYTGDFHMLAPDPFLLRLVYGLLKPKHRVLGNDIAGRVEAVGPEVQHLRPGDDVFGFLSTCGFGALAEYACAPESVLVRKPANITHQEAAAVPVSAMTALQGLRDKGRIQCGYQVLIHGASGGVGTFAIQIAKALGAEVTAVCSTRNQTLARSLGADHVIDYTQEDFSTSGMRYDVILAVNGNRSIFTYRRALAPRGVCVTLGGSGIQFFQSLLLGPGLSLLGAKKLRSMITKLNKDDLGFIGGLIEDGRIKPSIDRRYPLRETPEAFRYIGGGHARGKIIITVKE